MIIQCHRNSLLTACQLVNAAIAPKTTPRPILTNTKLVAADDYLTLLATDLEIGIRYEIRSVDVKESGEAILPIASLVAILRESTSNEVTIQVEETSATITTSSSTYTIPTERVEDFPDIPIFTDDKYLEVSAKVLSTLIQRTIFAAAKQDNKFAISGILWEIENQQVTLVGTDTRRLAIAWGPATVQGGLETSKNESHLVPPKAITLLDKTLAEGDSDQMVKVILRSNDILFQTERSTIYSRLIEGRYPPYRDVVNKKSSAKIQVVVGPFLAAIRQAAIMADRESRRVLFQFRSDRGILKATGPNVGSSKVEFEMKYDGPELNIHLDPEFLTDMLRVLDPEEIIQLELLNPEKPVQFRYGNDYLYLVIPIKVKEGAEN